METLPFIHANVGIIAHGDADGICSSAIIKTKYPGAFTLFSKASTLHKTIKEMENWAKTLDVLYIVDVAINPKACQFVLDRLAKVKKRHKIIFIDNHLLPWEIKESELPPVDMSQYVDRYLKRDGWSSSALTFSLLYGDTRDNIINNRKAALLGTYGAIADYARDCPLTKSVFSIWDESNIQYQAFLLKQASRVIKSNDLKRVITDKLSVGILPSEIREVVEAAREASREVDVAAQFIKDHAEIFKNIGILVECPVASMGHNAFVCATMTNKVVGVAISRKGGNAYFVLRKQHGVDIHLGELTAKVARDLSCDGGGEEATGGITAQDTDISQVLERINYYVTRYINQRKDRLTQ